MARMGKAAVFYGHKQPFRIETLEWPEPENEEVLVKTAACGFCHTDLHVWAGELPGFPLEVPCILGHEPAGYIEAKGSAVPEHIEVGQPVLVQGGFPAKDDIYSLKGHHQISIDKSHIWTGSRGLQGGAYAEYVMVPSYRYLVEADGLDLLAASTLTDAALTPYRAAKLALHVVSEFAEAGDFVVVVGPGGLGAYAPQILNARAPYLNVITVGRRDEVLELASKHADVHTSVNIKKADPIEAIASAVGDKKVVAVLDFVTTAETVSTFSTLLAPRGAFMLLGLGALEVTIPVPSTVVGEITYMGSLWGSVADLREVVALARKGMLHYKELVTKSWKLDEINDAFTAMQERNLLGRMVIVP
jgi:propanol-preferring alcohol dehydrogenase